MDNYQRVGIGDYASDRISDRTSYSSRIDVDYNLGNGRGAYASTGEGDGILTAPKVKVK